MALLAPPSEITVAELEDLYAQDLKCTWTGEEGKAPETCDEVAVYAVIPKCGHTDTMCTEHAAGCSRYGLLCDFGHTDWCPKVVPL